MKTAKVFTGVLAAMLLFLSGFFAYAGEVRGVTDDTVKLGLIIDQTGPAASIAVTMIEGFRSLIRHTNDQGGIHGRQVRLIVEDDRYSIPSALSAFKKLLFRDQVFALGGPSSTGAFTVLASQIQKAKVPFISIIMPEITVKPFKRYVFIFADIYPNQMKVLVDYVIKDMKLKEKKIALVYPDNQTGKTDSASAVERLKLHNITPVTKEVLSPGAFDASSQVMNLKRAKTNALILCGMIPPPASVIIRDLKKFGVSFPIFGAWATCVEEIIQMTGDASEHFYAVNSMSSCPSINGLFAQYLRYARKIILGISNICPRLFFSHALILNKNPHFWTDTSSWYDDGQGVAKMRDITLKYRPGTEKPYRGKLYTQGWMMSLVLLEGLKRAGRDLDEEAYINALESIKNWNTGELTGPLNFSSTSHKGGDTWKMFKADPKSGKFIPMTGWRKAE